MKKLLTLLFIALICSAGSYAQKSAEGSGDQAAIKTLIQTAYVDGLQNKGDLEATRKGFDPGFNLLSNKSDRLGKYPISKWIASTERAKQAHPGPPKQLTTCEFELIDITGKAAMAKVHLFKAGKKIYTDYLSLYKFNNGWRIVSKIYHKH